MKTQALTLIIAAAMCAISGSALAWQGWDAQEIKLKDGRTLLVFSDGKMALRDSKGRVVHGRDGETLVTAKGDTIQMKGNEVQRVTKNEAMFLGY